MISIDTLLEKYADLERRDIWEYRLSLNEAETLRLMEHLWELRQTNFDYYFFDDPYYHMEWDALGAGSWIYYFGGVETSGTWPAV